MPSSDSDHVQFFLDNFGGGGKQRHIMKTFSLTLVLAAAVAAQVARADQAEPATPVVPRTNTVTKFSPNLPVAQSIIEKLNLTADQQTKVADLKTQYGTEHLDTSKKVIEANKPIFDEWRKLKTGENDARRQELTQQLTKNSQLLNALNEQYKAKFVELLTPEQKTKYTALEAEAKLPQLVFAPTLEKLQLSAEQQTKYQALLKEYREAVQKPNELRKKTADELQAARKEDNKEKVAELQKKLSESYREGAAARTQYLEKFKALLTDEQKTKYEEVTRPTKVPARPQGQ